MSKKKKILHLIDHLGVGGAQEIVHDLCKLTAKDFDCSVAYIFKKDVYKEKIELLGVDVYSLGLSENYNKLNSINPLLLFRLINLVNRGKYDIIHIHLYVVSFWAIFLKIVFPKIKVINTIHATKPMFVEPVYLIYRISRFFTDIFVAEYDSTVVDLKQIGVKDNRFRRINFGTDVVDNFKQNQTRGDLRKELGLLENEKILVSIARLSIERRINLFVEMMPTLLKEYPGAKLLIVGTGPEEERLKDLVVDLNLSEKVLFLGYRNDLPELLTSSDVYLTVFENRSPISIAAIQAWVYSMAVAGYNLGDMSLDDIRRQTPFITVCKEKEELVFELSRILRDDELKKEYGRQGFEYANKNYSLKNMVDEYDQLYRSLTE